MYKRKETGNMKKMRIYRNGKLFFLRRSTVELLENRIFLSDPKRGKDVPCAALAGHRHSRKRKRNCYTEISHSRTYRAFLTQPWSIFYFSKAMKTDCLVCTIHFGSGGSAACSWKRVVRQEKRKTRRCWSDGTGDDIG